MKCSLLAILSLLVLPTVALAGGSQGFVPLVGIPGLDSANTPTFDDYIDALYALAISVAALIAVIQIVIGGAQYMMDDLITSKSAAKERIKNALIGLLIIIAAALILTTINSDLTRLEISAPVIEVDNSRPDPVDYIESVAEMADEALARNTELITDNCDGDLLNPLTNLPLVGDWFATCEEECQEIGGIMSYEGLNSCTYLQDNADQCNPQRSELCCAYIKGGTWNESAGSCSGVEVAQAALREACYERRNNWDATAGTCRTNACNRNTDAACCSLGYNGTLTGGVCNTQDGPPVLPPVNNDHLNSALAGIPQGMTDSIRTRVQENIGGENYISNSSDITTIINDQDAEGVYVAARIPNGIGEETEQAMVRGAVEGICNDISSVNDSAGVVEGELSDGSRYIACAR